MEPKNKQPILTVEDLSLTIDGKKILKDISFSIIPEEVLAIIGPNGSGKSMLLKTLVGIHTPTSGTITWAPDTKIGYLPQRFQVEHYLPMTIEEFLLLKKSPEYSLNEVFSLVKIEKGWRTKNLAHLSSGQLQKILLAWAILDKPEILLFDEPMENVDITGQESIYRLLHELQETLYVALIIVSHDLNLVYRYADQVLCLNQKMLCYGAPHDELTEHRIKELFDTHTLFHHDHDKNHAN